MQGKLLSILTQPTAIRRDPWLWALLLGIALFLALPGATAWQGDHAAVIQAALDANAAGRPATAIVPLPVAGRLASPAAIWPYQLLLLLTRNPLALTFLKNLLLLGALLASGDYCCRRLEIPTPPMLAAILLLPYSWLLLRPLDDAALALPCALLAFAATLGYCADATDHPRRELAVAIAAALGCAALTLQPATPLATLGLALLLAPPPSQATRTKRLRLVGAMLLLAAAANLLWLLRFVRGVHPIPLGRSLLALTAALPRFVSTWKLSLQPSPVFLQDLSAPLRWLWLAGEYLTYALALMALAAGVLATLMRRAERQTTPLIQGALLALPALALHLCLNAALRQGGLHRDLITIIPVLFTLLAMGLASLRNYLRIKYNCIFATALACAAVATGCYDAKLYVLAGDDRPDCFGSTLAMQWEVTRQLESYADAQPPPKVFNYARCFQYAPQQLVTLRNLAAEMTLTAPDYLPESVHIRQRREGTGLLEVETRF